MFYCINPNYRYQFFNQIGRTPEDPGSDSSEVPVDDKPSKRNLVNALAALYRAYGGKEELKNNAVDIIYKIAEVVQPINDTEKADTGTNPGELKPEDKY